MKKRAIYIGDVKHVQCPVFELNNNGFYGVSPTFLWITPTGLNGNLKPSNINTYTTLIYDRFNF